MKLLKAAGALTMLVALLVVVPWALWSWAAPTVLLEVDWSTALLRPDDGRIILGLLGLIGLLAWATVAATTVLELVSVLTREAVSIRLPGTAWARPGIAALVAAALAPAISASAVAPDATPPPLASVASFAPGEDAHERVLDDSPLVEETRVPPGQAYTVAHGDELWSLAERTLGSGERWREILTANPGLSHDEPLTPGNRIWLPAPAVASAGVQDGQPTSVEVAEGDTLWDLAEEHLGDPHRWPEIHSENQQLIPDPDLIEVGWELLLPAADEPGSGSASDDDAPPVEDSTHTQEQAPDSSPAETLDPAPHQTEPADRAESTPPSPPVPTEPSAPATPPPAADQAPPPPGTGSQGSPSDPSSHRPALQTREVASDVLGPVGAVLAAGIFAGVAARRRTQLLQRAVGRRVLPVRPELQRFWTMLGRRSAEGEDETPATLGETGVILGWDASDDVVHDLETARCTVLAGSPEHTAALASAVLTSLLCAPWSTATELVVVEPQEEWQAGLDDPRIREVDSLEDALVDLQKLCATRRIELGSAALDEVRADPELASAWVPVVYLFSEPVPAEGLARIAACLALGRVGVSVLAPVLAAPGPGSERMLVRIESDDHAVLTGDGRSFVPQLLTAPARRAVVELFSSATSTDTDPAPWWDDDPLPPNVKVLPRTTNEPAKDSAMPARSVDPVHPTLLLLGPTDLSGIAGQRPQRSVTAALEACTWLLQHPGATPTQMRQALGIAEATRRSNVSRLRTWLGNSPDGEPYLPDAYTGQLELHPEVTSDWERFQVLVSGGINHVGPEILVEALTLVRGEPLAGVAFQWPWAEGVRTDMVSMVTDAAAVLADLSLDAGDLDRALWAITQGRLAAGEDESLTVREIHLHALAGDRPQVDHTVRHLTRAARAAGRDLSEESVRRIGKALSLVVTGRQAT